MTEVRPELGAWIPATADALKVHANQLLGPALASWGLTMLFVLPVSMGIGVAAAAMIIVTEPGNGDPPTWIIPLMMGFFVLFFIALLFFNGVLLHTLYRWCLALLRGEKPTAGSAIPGFGTAILAGLLPMIQMILSLLGAPFCLVPSIWIGLTLGLAGVAHADRQQGLVDAISVSMELSSGRKLQLFLFQMVLMIAVMILSYIPLIGPIAMFPVLAMAYAVVYRSLADATAQSA